MRKWKHMCRIGQARPAGWVYSLSVGSLDHKTTSVGWHLELSAQSSS